MRIRGQICMVMNLDKCIGCHTCSVTCKNTWTNRKGTEYMWFNDVETKPGVGYPKRWEDQTNYKGGWELKNGKLRLKQGGKLRRLFNIFFNPVLPTIDDYYEPWSYNYDTLVTRKQGVNQPVAKPISLITGGEAQLKWGPNWEDDLAGSQVTGPQDPNWRDLEEKVRLDYENAFMFYLPRICEHCLNPSCVASCPAGAIYKRVEDGIVLVDQEACRGWRFCISGCPYKKVYFNWHTHKAEKCTFCYPRIEAGMPTVCSETCVGRIRYIGMMLYDADRVLEAASASSDKDLYEAQLSIFLDPNDPDIASKALDDGIPWQVVESAKKSPVYKMIAEWRIALPLHPEYRTLPMVWYVPPLSPIVDAATAQGGYTEEVFPLIEQMRIPIKYLANLLAAGDEEVVRGVLKKLAALRSYMRAKTLGRPPDEGLIKSVGLSVHQVEEMYRLLAIGKYEERFVIPTTHKEEALDLYNDQGLAGLPFYEKEMYAKYLATKHAQWQDKRAGDNTGENA